MNRPVRDCPSEVSNNLPSGLENWRWNTVLAMDGRLRGGMRIVPEIERRIGSPGAPGLGEPGKLTSRFQPGCPEQPQVGCREGIGPSQSAHRDVMGRPIADSGKLQET